MTIRGRILIALLVMSVITAALGAYTTMGVRNAGMLVDKTFDESLMSINYARAAATDSRMPMRAAFARRWIATDPNMRRALADEMDKLGKSLSEDLDIAAQRSQSVRATRAAESVKRAVAAWQDVACARLIWTARKATSIGQPSIGLGKGLDDEIDLFVNYTAGDGFLYRQSAWAVVRHRTCNLTSLASRWRCCRGLRLVASALARRIAGPVAVASNVAKLIAAGNLDVAVPKGSADELGVLLASMGVMRDNIKAMMDSEVEQRRSAQGRLADALENSPEGVVVVDADDGIVLANAQAADLLGVPAFFLKPGTPPSHNSSRRWFGRCRACADAMRQRAARDPRGVDGERAMAAHQPLADAGSGLHRVVQRHQPAEEAGIEPLRETNLLLDVARSKNMSQGLCLYDLVKSP